MRNIKNSILFFTSVFFVCIACENKIKTDDLLVLEDIKTASSELLITKAIALETTVSNLLGQYLTVRYDENSIWILDKDNSDAVHGFDWDGKSLGYVAVVGEGPDQLINIMDFHLKNDVIEVLSNLGDQVIISKFSKENQLLSKFGLPFNAFSFISDHKNEYWMYSGYNLVAGEYRLVVFDELGNLTNKHLKNDFHEKMIPYNESSFFNSESSILFKESYKPTVFELSKTGPEQKYSFDFGAYTTPEDYWKLDAFKGFDLINEKGFINIEFIAENTNFAIFDLFIQKEDKLWKELIILNRIENKAIKLKLDFESDGQFVTPIGIADDQILFISYAPYLVRNQINLSPNAAHHINSIKESDNSVILYAKIPNF